VEYCSFNASKEKARSLSPTTAYDEANARQEETAEAVRLLTQIPQTTIGGARDVREYARDAARNFVLEPDQLLDIKYTLIASRTLKRTLERLANEFPQLAFLSLGLPQPTGLVDWISKTLSDRGEVLDSASSKLKTIRRDLRIHHDRLLTRMQAMLSDQKITPYLQDNLVTQRDGRYVIPVIAGFKGKVKGIIHDQSASGATIFIEPIGVVDLNNKYRSLILEERDEVRRVLAELSQLVGEQAAVLIGMVEALGDLDLAFARAKYAQDITATKPLIRKFKQKAVDANISENASPFNHPGVVIKLLDARHPLLDPKGVVPVDVVLDPQTYALIITGPNTGGKTVTLKTVGLLALMAQSGMHIPAETGSEISLFENIFADIGDEQSIEQSLSTFSGHITNIIRILELADSRSLVILDELGAGTDPQEGSALARALLDTLLMRGITTLVTSHHPDLKAYAHKKPGVVNASVEFDIQSLKPTFRLSIGLPGKSNALAIAERLGIPDKIVQSARAEIDPADLQAEDLLDEIHKQRDMAKAARSAAEGSRKESERIRRELASRLENIEDERRELLNAAREEGQYEVAEIQKEIRRARRELSRARQPLDVIAPLEKSISHLEASIETPVAREVPDILPSRGPLRLGSKVRLRALKMDGIITSLGKVDAEVQVGNLRVRARLGELVPKNTQSQDEVIDDRSHKEREFSAPKVESPGIEIDLRGNRADDAIDSLDIYLERAYTAGLPWVRIIHGKGTGKLRQVVRQTLSEHPQILSFEPGKRAEGGDGVTVGKFRK
jgi:DNA mismatch repair protein MutS2